MDQIFAKALTWMRANINNVHTVITAIEVIKARFQLLYGIENLVISALWWNLVNDNVTTRTETLDIVYHCLNPSTDNISRLLLGVISAALQHNSIRLITGVQDMFQMILKKWYCSAPIHEGSHWHTKFIEVRTQSIYQWYANDECTTTGGGCTLFRLRFSRQGTLPLGYAGTECRVAGWMMAPNPQLHLRDRLAAWGWWFLRWRGSRWLTMASGYWTGRGLAGSWIHRSRDGRHHLTVCLVAWWRYNGALTGIDIQSSRIWLGFSSTIIDISKTRILDWTRVKGID